MTAHGIRYKNSGEAHALKEVVTGGGSCTRSDECGEGYCSFRRCLCYRGWVGPHCKVRLSLLSRLSHQGWPGGGPEE
jgi:hypothetical protein